MEGLDNFSKDKDKVLPVILCGGVGTRLWPLSRKSFPKQFLSINSSNNNSLLQNTQKRLEGIKGLIDPILICNSEHRFIVAEQMREINVTPKSIILEPFGRNTAPAILIAAFKSLEIEDNPNLLILSADHQINKNKAFKNLIEMAKEYSSDNKLVTFGVIPLSPETGYGYIKSEKPFDKKTLEGIKISQFIEKLAFNTGTGHLDVLCDYCIKKEIEVESVSKFLTASLKNKIKEEALDLNLLKEKRKNKLPL